MVVLFGIRAWKRKVVAYRNDFCLACEAPVRAHQIRSLQTFHLFFIPVLPLYPRWDWECSRCERPPHSDPQTHPQKTFKRLLVFFSGMFALVVWVAPPSETGNSPAVNWVLRIVLTSAFLVSLWYAVKLKVSLFLSQKLKEIKPDEGHLCALCDTPLMPGPRWRCPGCGVVRTAL